MKPIPVNTRTVLTAILLALFSAVSTQAVDIFWTDGTATYNNPANWGGAIPTASDNAIVNNGGTVLINPGDPDWATFDIRAGQSTGNGAYIQNGPTVTLNAWFRLAVDPGTTGTYTLLSGTLNANPAFHVGEAGTGVLNIFGGTINHGGTDAIIIGDHGPNANTLGFVYHTNGTLNSSSEIWVGQGGALGGPQAGEYDLSGNGAINVNNWLAVGRANAVGVFNITNGTVVKTGGGNIIAGSLSGTGTFNQYAGTVINTNSALWLGEGAGGSGIWNLFGGTDNFSVIQLSLANGGSGDGTFNLNGGLLIATEIRNGGGIGSSIFNFNGGTLQAAQDNATFMHDLSTASVLAGGAIIDSGGHNITFPQTLFDGGGGGSLTKLGSGTLTLAGGDNYSGMTIVKAGKLIASTASFVSSDVVVSNTAGFGVDVTTANTQVNRANVTLAGPANTLDFSLGNFGNPLFAPLNVNGTLTVNGTTTVNIADALPQVGQFPLIKYTTRAGSGTFVLGTLPVGVSAVLVNNTGNSSIDLNITSTSVLRWDGLFAAGAWDINTTSNWTDYATGLPAKYTEGAAVYFDDLALGTTTVNLGVTVNPGSIIVTNDNLPYSLTGSGKINGITGFTKQGTNSFAIANTTGNTYTGPTVISGGTLSINSLANGGSPSSIGSSSSNAANLVLDGGTLSYSGPPVVIDRGYSITHGSTLDLQADVTFNGPVNATLNANFMKSGSGTLFVKRPGANTLSAGGGGGAYNIAGGSVVLDGSAGGQTNNITGELWVGGTTNSGASLVLSNTALNLSSWFAIARGSGTSGYTSTANVYNSQLRSVNFSMAYDNGIAGTLQTGILNLNSSTYTNTGDSNIGESSGAQATITLNDSSVFFGNNRAMIGWHNNATGLVTIASSAKVVVNAWMSMGNEGGVGTVIVKDNGSLVLPGGVSDLNVCDVNGGIGTLIVSNNATVKANNIFVGKGATSFGTLIQAGSSSVSSANGGGANVVLGNSAGSSGTINLNGGTLSASRVSSAGGTTTLYLNGGVLKAGNGATDAGFMAGLTLADIELGGAIIDSSNNNITIDQPLSGDAAGDGGLTKLGSGRLALNGVNTYTNTTTVSAGTLGGNGTIAGPVIVQPAGTLAPGVGIGTLTINNNLTLAGNVLVNVDRSLSPSNSLVVVSGTLNNTGTGTLRVNNIGTNALQIGDKFTVFSKPVANGSAITVAISAGVVWQNNLAVDGSIHVLSMAAAPAFSPGGVSELPDGNISLTATGPVTETYKLWASTNVALAPISSTWTLLQSGTITVSPFTIHDLTATNYPRRFYIFSTP